MMEQNLEQNLELWNLVTRQPHSITAPSHLTRIEALEREDTMFSCCLPVCRGRGLKRGSDESICRCARCWVQAQPRRRLWPFSRRNPKSSAYVKKEQQLLEEDPMSHTTKRQGRREVRVATWGSGEPRPLAGQPGTLPPKLPRFFGPVTPKQPRFPRPPSPKQPWFNRQLTIFTRDLDYSAHGNQTGPENLEAKEAEPKAPAQEAEAAPPVTPKVHPEEQNAELEASPPPELSPPPAASPAAAVEPGPAPEETEAPAPLEEEPSLEPMLVPASEEELPVEGPAQAGPRGTASPGSRGPWPHPDPGPSLTRIQGHTASPGPRDSLPRTQGHVASPGPRGRGLSQDPGRVASPGSRGPRPPRTRDQVTRIQGHGLTQDPGPASPGSRGPRPHPDPGPRLTWIQGPMASPGPGTQPHPDPGGHTASAQTQDSRLYLDPGTWPHPDQGRVAFQTQGAWPHPDPGAHLIRPGLLNMGTVLQVGVNIATSLPDDGTEPGTEPGTLEPSVTRQPHSITAPSHLTRIEALERTPCFHVVSQCAEVEASREAAMRVFANVPALGPDSVQTPAVAFLTAEPKGTGLGLIQAEGAGAQAAVTGPGLRTPHWLMSSTYVKKEQQLLEESPCDMGSSEGPVSHTTEGQDRPEVRVATWASGEPGPVDGQPGTPPPQPPRLFWPPTPKPTRFHRPPTPKHPRFHRQRKVFTRDLDYGAHVNRTGQEHLEAPKRLSPRVRSWGQ
ncbi:hypothetical protein QTO34_005544 [Cnephaeus nilssonii]|uniref:Uncharacterized protein n=1 Tax=Cnephaeus nilssonii TaxID=3371016 RepID=A0AA40HNQ8_CNENI|nr:hypothetical protein QTO34_005544 [Eptesicus nilssonii]